jgi:hypothetical protein
MKTTLTTLALCSGLIALPIAGFAQMTKMSPAMDATMMCRPAMTGEKATAMMGTKGIVCKAMPKMDMSKMGPDTKGMSAAEADAAWRKWLSEMMAIPMAGGAGG